jgi:DNA-binding transcriptional LysR family regulator
MKHINFDLQQLQAFIAIAERGSFRAAADHIHISPPALSRRIEKLESIIGIKLFIRTTRKVELTSVGRIFLERARSAIDDLESAILGISDIAVTRVARVTVACVPSAALYFLPNVIRNFSFKYPSIRIRVIDESMNQTLQSVLIGESDFGIGFMNTLMPEIEFEGIHDDPFVIAMRRDHPLSKRRVVNWSHIQNEQLISVARSSGNRQLLDDVMSKIGKKPNYAFEVSHIGTLLGMVEAGLGIAAVPRAALPINHPTVIGLALKNPTISRCLGLLRKHGSVLRPAAEIFHEYLQEALCKQRLANRPPNEI